MRSMSETEKEQALCAFASMITRSEKAQMKFTRGTAQYTLLANRIKALYIASSLLTKEAETIGAWKIFTREDIKKALEPIASLIQKSEKAQDKLAQNSWQHAMLSENLRALYMALPLLEAAVDGLSE